MTKFKNDNYKFWHSPLALILLFIVLLFFGYKIIDLLKKERETSYQKELVLDKIEKLKERESSLSRDISRIETEEGKEEIIREKYQVAKDGEKMVIIVEEGVKVGDSLVDKNVEGHRFWNWIKRTFNR